MTHATTAAPKTAGANHFCDTLIAAMKLKNDAALSRALGVAPPVISKIRHRRLPIGASLLIRAHEVSDLSIADLKAAADIPRFSADATEAA